MIQSICRASLVCYLYTALIGSVDAADGALLSDLAPGDFAKTLELYLGGDSAYQPGDLVTASQLEEFQVYFRRAKGNSIVTHARWRKRLLPDTAPLSKLFFSEGRAVLRSAAKEMGGYMGLDHLSRDQAGRTIIRQAIASQSPELIIAEIKSRHMQEQDNASNKKGVKPTMKASQRIYTANDFLTALAASAADSSVSASAEKKKI